MYQIFKCAINVTDNDACLLSSFAKRRGCCIFNPDDKRIQASISSRFKIIKEVQLFLNNNTGVMYGRTFGPSVVLHSYKGCKKQKWHTDYDVEDCKNIRKKPKSVIIAIENRTVLDVLNTEQIVLQRGDMIVFDGDLVHAGSAYITKDNTRIHMYLDSVDVERVENTTYIK
jgi:hypothetical protein